MVAIRFSDSRRAEIFHHFYMDNDNAIPTIPSLVKICDAFQITLSEFFAKAEGSGSVPVALTPQQMQVIEKWSILRPDQQEAVLNLLNTIP